MLGSPYLTFLSGLLFQPVPSQLTALFLWYNLNCLFLSESLLLLLGYLTLWAMSSQAHQGSVSETVRFTVSCLCIWCSHFTCHDLKIWNEKKNTFFHPVHWKFSSPQPQSSAHLQLLKMRESSRMRHLHGAGVSSTVDVISHKREICFPSFQLCFQVSDFATLAFSYVKETSYLCLARS